MIWLSPPRHKCTSAVPPEWVLADGHNPLIGEGGVYVAIKGVHLACTPRNDLLGNLVYGIT